MRLKDFRCVLCDGALSWVEGYERPKLWQAECKNCRVKYGSAYKSRAESCANVQCWLTERFNKMSEEERKKFIKTRKEELAKVEAERQKWLEENPDG